MYIEVKVKATIYTNLKKTTTTTLEQTFMGYDHTKVGALASINKQIKIYANNPYIAKVERIGMKEVER